MPSIRSVRDIAGSGQACPFVRYLPVLACTNCLRVFFCRGASLRWRTPGAVGHGVCLLRVAGSDSNHPSSLKLTSCPLSASLLASHKARVWRLERLLLLGIIMPESEQRMILSKHHHMRRCFLDFSLFEALEVCRLRAVVDAARRVLFLCSSFSPFSACLCVIRLFLFLTMSRIFQQTVGECQIL